MEDKIYWNYYPKLFDASWRERVFQDIEPRVRGYTNKIYGKEYPARRLSCYFQSNKGEIDARAKYFDYGHLQVYDWDDSELVKEIRAIIEKKFETKFDYVLIHLYPNGIDGVIGYHADRESLNEDIISVSFGATRKFRLRKLGQTKGYEKQFLLNDGDVIHMLKGCQKNYKHSVPTERKVKEARINFTFRKYDT